MSEGIQPSITLSTTRRSDRHVVIFIGGADLVAAPAAKLRRKRDRKQPRRGARRKAARPSRGFVRREPRRRDRLRAPVHHGAVTPERSGQFDAVEKPLSSLAALRRSVGDDMKRRRCRVPSVSLFELLLPSPFPARWSWGGAHSFTAEILYLIHEPAMEPRAEGLKTLFLVWNFRDGLFGYQILASWNKSRIAKSGRRVSIRLE
jgi:hypothetical protein